MKSYDFDPNLARAHTPPREWYFDPDVLALERERIFSRTWQLAGRSRQVAEPGRYLTGEIAGEPVIAARGRDGHLRALSNVCRHRGGPVAAGHGDAKTFQCGYHGWTYDLEGCLIGTPEFEGVEEFSKSETSLPAFRIEEWLGLVFVNLDTECAPLLETLQDLPLRLEGRDLDRCQPAARKEWQIESNWKVYVDNYLEGYHIPVVHPGLLKEIDYPAYWTETAAYYSIQHSPIRRSSANRLRADAGAHAALYVWIFPNLMLNIYPDNFSTNLILPLGPERTLTIFEWFFRDPHLPEVEERVRDTVSFSDEIQLEDMAICESVQRGLRSRTYATGRYSVRRENGVHHFHGLLAEHLERD